MESYFNKIKAEIKALVKQQEEKPIVSERDDPIFNVLIKKYYSSESGENQLLFKDTVAKLLFKYFNVSEEIANPIVFHLIYVCFKVKIPLDDSLLIDILKAETLKDRNYEGKELNLLILQLLSDIPIAYRNQKELLNLIKRPDYKNKLSYCLHFLELFGKKGIDDGVTLCMNYLRDLHIRESDVPKVSLQMFSTFRIVRPLSVHNWWLLQLKMPEKLKGNLLYESLLQFVSGARKQKAHFKDWEATLNLISANEIAPFGVGFMQKVMEARA